MVALDFLPEVEVVSTFGTESLSSTSVPNTDRPYGRMIKKSKSTYCVIQFYFVPAMKILILKVEVFPPQSRSSKSRAYLPQPTG